MAMAKEPTVASTAMFSGAHHQSFKEADFRTAGNDMYMGPTFNVNFNASPTSTTLPSERSAQEQRSSFVEQVLKFFRSPEAGNALAHRHPMRIEQAANGASSSTQQNVAVSVAEESCKPPNECQKLEDGFSVLALDDPDLHSMQAQVVTHAEIYVRNMLCARAGLACWSPRPRRPFTGETGVIPGDVGTYDLTDGFKPIFNIWKDWEALRERINTSSDMQSFEPPPEETTFHPDELEEGATIVSGTSSDVHESQDGQITSFEFHCTSEQGAVLACTSSADLEELVHPVALRDFLIQYAGVVYQHANTVRRVADEDSLYIVSGCIKSDSWALAAYKDPAQAPHDVLKLARKAAGNRVGQIPAYRWTLRGTAEARSGVTSTPMTSERNQRKDQCLFLRGFKLCLSKDFRRRLKDSPLEFDHDSYSKDAAGSNPKGPHRSQGGHGQGRGDGASSRRNESQGSGTSAANPPPSSQSFPLETGVQISSFPPSLEKTVHPCDKIAGILLEMTGADCALSHDDDWRLGSDTVSSWDDNSCIDLLQTKVICARNGVAYLLSRDDQLSQSSKAVSQAMVPAPPDTGNLGNPAALPTPAILPPSPSNVTGGRPTDLSNQDKSEPLSLSGEETTSRPPHWCQSEEEAVLSEGFVKATSTSNTKQAPINSERSSSPSTPSATSPGPVHVNLVEAPGAQSAGQRSATGSFLGSVATSKPVLAKARQGEEETGMAVLPSAPNHSGATDRLSPPEYSDYYNPPRSLRVSPVCQECERLELRCDRKNPCGSCLKMNTVERCLYSGAAERIVDIQSLNDRLTAMEAVMGAYSRGVPIYFTPTYPSAIQAMEERIAAYASLGGSVNPPPQSAAVQTTDHPHDPAKAKAQPFSFSAPVDTARSIAGENFEGLKVGRQPTPNRYSFEMVNSQGVASTSLSAIVESMKQNNQPLDTPTRQDYEYEIFRSEEKLVESNSHREKLLRINGGEPPGSEDVSPISPAVYSPTESHHQPQWNTARARLGQQVASDQPRRSTARAKLGRQLASKQPQRNTARAKLGREVASKQQRNTARAKLDRQVASYQPLDNPTRQKYEYNISRLKERLVELEMSLRIDGDEPLSSEDVSPVSPAVYYSPTESHHQPMEGGMKVRASGMRYTVSV